MDLQENAPYIHSLLQRYGFRNVRPSRNGFTASCPFHEDKHPSFSISRTGLWMCWSCFSPDTMVTMADLSMKPISEVSIGDMVLGEHGTPEQVTAVMSREYHGRVTKIRFRGIPWVVVATPEHKFHMSRFNPRPGSDARIKFWEAPVRAEVESALIRKSDLAIMASPVSIPSEPRGLMYWPEYHEKKNGFSPKQLPAVEMTPDLAITMGLYIAEGSASCRTVEFSFHAKEGHLADIVEREIGRLGVKTSRRIIGSKMDVRACSVTLCHAMEQLFGHGATNKGIPQSIINMGDDVLRNVVKGIFLGDGHANKNALTITTISEKLASQLFTIGLRLGRPARVSSSPAAVRGGVNHRKSYQVTFPFNPPKILRSDFHGFQYRVDYAEPETYHGRVYNITVEPSHKYFVSGALVNNCKAAGNIKKLNIVMGGGEQDWKDSLKALGVQLRSAQFKQVVHKKNDFKALPADFIAYPCEDKVPAPILARLRWNTIQHFQLGYVPQNSPDWRLRNRCIVPILYKQSAVGFHGRALLPEQQPRYYNPAGFDIKEHVFNFDSCTPGGEVIIVEGAFNAMSMWERGFPNTMAVFGTKYTTSQVNRILSLSPSSVVICFDRDPSKVVDGNERGKQGQKAAHELGKILHDAVPTFIMPLPIGKDPNDLPADILAKCYDKKVAYEKLFGYEQ